MLDRTASTIPSIKPSKHTYNLQHIPPKGLKMRFSTITSVAITMLGFAAAKPTGMLFPPSLPCCEFSSSDNLLFHKHQSPMVLLLANTCSHAPPQPAIAMVSGAAASMTATLTRTVATRPAWTGFRSATMPVKLFCGYLRITMGT